MRDSFRALTRIVFVAAALSAVAVSVVVALQPAPRAAQNVTIEFNLFERKYFLEGTLEQSFGSQVINREAKGDRLGSERLYFGPYFGVGNSRII
jgi:hypothetical protein